MDLFKAFSARIFSLIFICCFLMQGAFSQPYGGTIFVDPDIIIVTDSSAYLEHTFKDIGSRTVYDRRPNAWVTIEAFLFDVQWSDGLSTEAIVNIEFGNEEDAALEVEKYALVIGQMPSCLRTDIQEIWIHQGIEPFGGGNHSILIHTGQSVLYENDGILEETIVHEASHTSLDEIHAGSEQWINAALQDNNYISTYARDNPGREDIAESFLMWLAVRYRKERISEVDFDLITQAIPNRLIYFDEIGCDLFPFEIQNSTSNKNTLENNSDVNFFPNPTSQWLHVDDERFNDVNFKVVNPEGRPVLVGQIDDKHEVDLKNLPPGIYWVIFSLDDRNYVEKIVKI